MVNYLSSKIYRDLYSLFTSASHSNKKISDVHTIKISNTKEPYFNIAFDYDIEYLVVISINEEGIVVNCPEDIYRYVELIISTKYPEYSDLIQNIEE